VWWWEGIQWHSGRCRVPRGPVASTKSQMGVHLAGVEARHLSMQAQREGFPGRRGIPVGSGEEVRQGSECAIQEGIWEKRRGESQGYESTAAGIQDARKIGRTCVDTGPEKIGPHG